MTELAARSVHPNRICIWPVETGGYGIDFTYHGATGFTDAEFAEKALQAGGLKTSFRQELDGAWTVRFGRSRASTCAKCSTASPGD